MAFVAGERKYSVLFICLGNICRSPCAEGVFKSMLKSRKLDSSIDCDSAGIIGYHCGDRADVRMRHHASMRGYSLDHISRKFNPAVDFDRFDLIVGMDDQNVHDLLHLSEKESDRNKIVKMSDYCSSNGNLQSDKIHGTFAKSVKPQSVPDPYYGGDAGFELVLDLLEDSCSNLIDEIVDHLH